MEVETKTENKSRQKLTTSNLREVVLYPTRQWGGEGLVGCGIGYVLHNSSILGKGLITDTVFFIVYPAQRLLQQHCSTLVQMVISHLNQILSQIPAGLRSILQERPMGRQRKLEIELRSSHVMLCHYMLCLCSTNTKKQDRISIIQLKSSIREPIRCP